MIGISVEGATVRAWAMAALALVVCSAARGGQMVCFSDDWCQELSPPMNDASGQPLSRGGSRLLMPSTDKKGVLYLDCVCGIPKGAGWVLTVVWTDPGEVKSGHFDFYFYEDKETKLVSVPLRAGGAKAELGAIDVPDLAAIVGSGDFSLVLARDDRGHEYPVTLKPLREHMNEMAEHCERLGKQ